MARAADSHARDPRAEAERVSLALDAIEEALAALAPGASPEAVARALAEPVAAFDRAVEEATEGA